MAKRKGAPIVLSISCHSWNGDRSQVAFSPNNNEVHIYNVNGAEDDLSKWTVAHVLKEHGGAVSGIDWCASTNNIVTAAHDRNAYVWKYETKESKWKPTLVILRINRAATSVKWSPAGNKFAVTSGAKCVPVCSFEETNDWWISKMIKKHKSTVLALDWCPNNKYVVTGGTDMKCRIFSAFFKEIDTKGDDDGLFASFGKDAHKFGACLAVFDQAQSWINAVSWSPDMTRIAFAGHGSTLSFATFSGDAETKVETVIHKDLPFLTVDFVKNDQVIAAGFDMNPTQFKLGGDGWAFDKVLDDGKSVAAPEKKTSAFGNARAMWGQTADKGTAFGAKKNAGLKTKSKNIINSVVVFRDADGNGTKISCSSLDGRITVWTV